MKGKAVAIHARIALFNAAVEIWTEETLRVYDQKNFVCFIVKPLPRAKNPLRHTTALPQKKPMRRRPPAHPPLLRAQNGYRRRPGRIYYEDGTVEDPENEEPIYFDEEGDDEDEDVY